MSKRLQILLDEREWDDLRSTAEGQGLSLSEWVRRALRDARRAEPAGDLGGKLDAVRVAVRHEFPTADVDRMLAEIERGYGPSGSE